MSWLENFLHQNKLPRGVVQPPSLEVFITQLYKPELVTLWAGCWTWTSQVSSDFDSPELLWTGDDTYPLVSFSLICLSTASRRHRCPISFTVYTHSYLWVSACLEVKIDKRNMILATMLNIPFRRSVSARSSAKLVQSFTSWWDSKLHFDCWSLGCLHSSAVNEDEIACVLKQYSCSESTTPKRSILLWPMMEVGFLQGVSNVISSSWILMRCASWILFCALSVF